MEDPIPLTWTGPLGTYLDPAIAIAALVLAVGVLVLLTRSVLATESSGTILGDTVVYRESAIAGVPFLLGSALLFLPIFGMLALLGDGLGTVPGLGSALASVADAISLPGLALIVTLVLAFLIQAFFPVGLAEKVTPIALWATLAIGLAYLVAGVFAPHGAAGIIGAMSARFLPVWIALIVTFVLSIIFKRRLGIYGKLFDNTVGMIGFALVMFWVFTAIFTGVFGWIATYGPYSIPADMLEARRLKYAFPGAGYTPDVAGAYPHYLLGGDILGRDVFSRMVHGSIVVMIIAPMATTFAFMVGITLGLPAGYFSGKLDTFLSFLANLVLAFPVILLFYLLVTPEIVETGIPSYMAMVLFIFPVIFVGILVHSRYYTQPDVNTPLLVMVLGGMGWLYFSMISEPDTVLDFMPRWLDLFNMDSGILVVFVSVVFVNSPTVFRIVRGLALDIKTRDYVAAAQTRGEGSWYVMLWEILPNARGPLIVDFCLRIGYTTILLGTLGFFGLGLEPTSPDWGSTINAARGVLSRFPHAALVPAFSLLTLVLGLNLLADGLREESLKD